MEAYVGSKGWGRHILQVEMCRRVLVPEERALKVNLLSRLGGRALKNLGHWLWSYSLRDTH